MRIFAWNPKGIKSLLAHREAVLQFVRKYQPDIVFFPESKPGCVAAQKQAEADLRVIFAEASSSSEWDFHWATYRERPYLHGNLAVIRRCALLGAYKVDFALSDDLGPESEGRIIVIDTQNGPVVVGVYVPNASTGLKRLQFKLDWLAALRRRLDSLSQSQTRPVIVIGDMNVAPDERDLCNPYSNRRTPGFTEQEREAYAQHLLFQYADVWREQHPLPEHKTQKHKGQYTFWTMRNGDAARNTNAGWRLDAVLVDRSTLRKQPNFVRECMICSDILGSDHCPVGLEIEANQVAIG
jgi:exodeoxyribonuclease III